MRKDKESILIRIGKREIQHRQRKNIKSITSYEEWYWEECIMNKVFRFLDQLNDEELYDFEKDIKSGTIQKFVEQKKEYFKVKDKSCSSCGNNINEDCLVLIYGDPRIGLRRKAHFCGTDCMEYFVNNNIRQKNGGTIKNDATKKIQKKQDI